MEIDFVNAANQIARASTATPLPVEVVLGGSTPTTQVLAFEATANGTGYVTGDVLTATITFATGAVVWKKGTTVIATPTTGTYKPLGAVAGGTADFGTAITGQSLEAGGVGNLGWLASIRKAVTDRLPAALVGGRLSVDLGASSLIGEVQASPTANTLLARLKALLDATGNTTITPPNYTVQWWLQQIAALLGPSAVQSDNNVALDITTSFVALPSAAATRVIVYVQYGYTGTISVKKGTQAAHTLQAGGSAQFTVSANANELSILGSVAATSASGLVTREIA